MGADALSVTIQVELRVIARVRLALAWLRSGQLPADRAAQMYFLSRSLTRLGNTLRLWMQAVVVRRGLAEELLRRLTVGGLRSRTDARWA